MPTSDLKKHQEIKRNLLLKLVNKAYQCTQKKKEELAPQEKVLLSYLGFTYDKPPYAVQQAAKYNRYQFVLPALPLWVDEPEANSTQLKLQQAFTFVFNDKNAKANYALLRKEHPDGVDCWVNPHEASKHPLIENNFATSADSILVAAKSILAKSQSEQTELLISAYGHSKKGDFETYVENRANEVTANIEHQRQQLNKSIKALYALENLDDGYMKKSRLVRFFSRKPKSPFEKQFERVQKELLTFQRYTIAQLTQFEQIDHQLPKEKDYKKMFKRLARAEQQIKLPSEQLPIEANQFNQDILALHVHENDKTTFQYHDRHYYLTEQQKQRLEINRDEKITTATAHSPEYLLSNYTMVEEGEIIEKKGDIKTTINHMGTHNGSHSPSELHKGNYDKYDKHLASYLALTNMEQTQLAIRVKLIESILKDVIGDAVRRIELSEQLALVITKKVHEKHLDDKKIEDTLALINECLIEVQNLQEAIEIFDSSAEIKAALSTQTINPSNYHTHLITAPGLGGVSENQRHQFYSARLAQYATQDKHGGIFYVCNGVNSMRWDSFFFDANDHKVKGNNAVAMVELFKHLKKIKEIDSNPFEHSNYEDLLTNVRQLAKEYYKELEENYLPAKKKVDDKTKEITALRQQKVALKKRHQRYPRTRSIAEQITNIERQLRDAKTALNELKEELREPKNRIDTKRSILRRTEALLHTEARRVNTTIYNAIKDEDELTGQWAIYQICQKLFSGTNWAGIDNWKLESNNGMFQALIQLLTDDTELFASSGCKSANDRELFVALLLTELIKEKKACESSPGGIFNLDYFNEAKRLEVRNNALKQLHTHSSNHQTQKDRSAMPKTNDSILVKGNKTLKSGLNDPANPSNYATLSERLKISKLAAHKRKSKAADNLNIKAMHFYGTHSATRLPSLLRNRWLHTKDAQEVKAITKYINHGFVVDKNSDEAEAYSVFYRNVTDDYKSDKKQVLLKNWLKLHHYCAQEIKGKKEVKLKKDIKKQLKQLKDSLIPIAGNCGEGFGQIKALLKGYDNEKGYSAHQLISMVMTLQEIAVPRASDWTNYFNSKNRFFTQQRPEWLKQLYSNLANMHRVGGIDFTSNIQFPDASEDEHLIVQIEQ